MNEVLKTKLREFIKKYYYNQLLKGVIYGVGISSLYFLLVTLLEYLGRFPGSIRFWLFVALVTGLVGIIGVYIIWPLVKLLGLGKQISHEQAARIIGQHFNEVDDKLINTLQLQNISRKDSDLVRASLNQRIAELSPVPFQSAIDLGQNRKYWPLLVIPVLIFGSIAISGNWSDFNESSRRIAEFNREFVPEAPFIFVLKNDDLRIEEGEDLEVLLGFEGSSIPMESYIQVNGRDNRMARRNDGLYHFKLSNLSENTAFSFTAAGWNSEVYEVSVIPVPKVNNIRVSVIPPGYTQIKPFVTNLKPVIDIPAGSTVSWQLNLEASTRASLVLAEEELEFSIGDTREHMLEKRVLKDLTYSVRLQNQYVEKLQIKDHSLEVIPDQFPDISARFSSEEERSGLLFIEGEISDDYGFSRLELIVEGEGVDIRRRISFDRRGIASSFTELLALDSLQGDDSKEVKVYLKVWDNDGVVGPKSSSSEVYDLRIKGLEEQEQELEERRKDYMSGASEMEQEQEQMQEQLSQMMKDIQGKKNLDWQDKNKLKELLDKQQELLLKQQEREEELKKLQEKEKKLGEKNEDVMEKEEQINEITPEDKELQELMKEIEDLMEKLNTDQLRDKLEKMQELNEQNQQAMDRKDELLKDLEFQKDVLKEAQKLNELGKKMKELSKDVQKDAQQDSDEQSEMNKQEEIEQEFKESLERIEKLAEENEKFGEELEKEGLEEQSEETQSELDKSKQNMKEQQQSPSNENQQNAGEGMQKMSESLQMAMMNMQSQQNEENLETLRQILENLKTLSFSVEELSISSKNTGKNDPYFKELLTEQKRLKDGSAIIEDSLVALGKRVPQLEQVVFEELAKVNSNLDKGIQNLEELQSAKAASNQQMVMTSANNLALLLDETMQSMLQAQAQMMKGNQNCQKPGGKNPKPSMQNMRKMQGELGKKMDQMKQGNKEGKGKEGQKMSKEIVEMLSRQEQLRQALEGMLKDAEGQGTKSNLQKAIEEMKRLENDLWDGELNNNYKERLKNIDTRLLESEKAELKQKKEKKRESQTADDQKQIYQEELEKYLKEKGIEYESIERVPVNFRLYYRDQATDYLKAK